MLLSEIDPEASSLARQERWRRRLGEAEREYNDAVVSLRGLEADSPAREAALKRRAEARENYLRILRIFTDFVLRGKEPPACN